MLTKESNETPYDDFVQMLKNKPRGIYASPSHRQTRPCEVSSFAILKFQYDGDIFFTTLSGLRVVISNSMPAFHLYNINFKLTI